MASLIRSLDMALLAEAGIAERRAGGSGPLRASASFVAIVASAAAVETYLVELLTNLDLAGLVPRKELQRIRKEPRVGRKYLLLARLWRQPLAQADEYRPLEALIVLRDCLTHHSVGLPERGKWPKQLEPFARVIPRVKGDPRDWTSRILNRRTAAWALRTANAFLTLVEEMVPDPGE